MTDLDAHLKAIRYAAVMREGDYVPSGSGEVAVSDLLLQAGAEIERLRGLLEGSKMIEMTVRICESFAAIGIAISEEQLRKFEKALFERGVNFAPIKNTALEQAASETEG